MNDGLNIVALKILAIGVVSIVISVFGVCFGPAIVIGPILGGIAVFRGFQFVMATTDASPVDQVIAIGGGLGGIVGVLIGLL
ncbi:MAG: hypothetical protein HN348_14900, partial [Proteobacteria bacterium]|nr:hypothetical protein [Pseudomonadota bacterium]